MKEVIKSSKPINFYENKVMEGFFESYTILEYFYSLKHADTKRDASFEVINILTKFVDLELNKKEVSMINEVINSMLRSKEKEIFEDSEGNNNLNTNDSSLSIKLKRISNKVFEWLDLKEPISIESLKIAYRKTAKKFHPDIGGNLEDMKILNANYPQFLSATKNVQFGYIGQNDSENSISENTESYHSSIYNNCEEFVAYCHMTLLQILTDLFLVNEAYKFYLIIAKNQNEYKQIETCCSHYIEPYYKNLVKQLIFVDINKAKEVFNYYKEFLKKNPYISSEAEEKKIKRIKEVMGGKNPLFAFNNLTQLKTALKNGIINQDQYDKKFQKLFDKEEVMNALKLKVLRFDFVILKIDKSFDVPKQVSELITEPGYFHTTFSGLIPSQIKEYLFAYYNSKDIKVIKKYEYIRLERYFKEFLKNPSSKLFEVITNEIKILKEMNIGNCFPFHSEDLLTLLKIIKKINKKDYKRKIKLLDQLDEKYSKQGFTTTITIDVETGEGSTQKKFPFRISMFQKKIQEIIQLDNQTLANLLHSGDFSKYYE
jgi:curved DNA-binding protein CbpA